MCSQWQRKAMAILLGIYLGTFHVFVRFLYVEKASLVLNCLITGLRRYSRDLPQGVSYKEVYIVGA